MTHSRAYLSTIQGLPTSGARAAAPFVMGDNLYLAVPQMAKDVAGERPYMNGGNSDIAMPIFIWRHDRFDAWQDLPVPGGEDAEYFSIGSRIFLATASLRTGKGPYRYDATSTVFEWDGMSFQPFQSFPTFAAKQWRYFSIDAHHFLALAQGVVMEGLEPAHPRASVIFKWNGKAFEEFQKIPSGWGYNFCALELSGTPHLAYADHHAPSALMRWTGKAFETIQAFDERNGRAFEPMQIEGQTFLAFANLLGDTQLYRWEDGRFVTHQKLSGPGAREFASLVVDGEPLLVQANFLTGAPKEPKTDLDSVIYRWRNGRFDVAQRFPTLGATDVAVFKWQEHAYLAVSESLSADVRFRTDSHVHRLE